MTVARRYVEAAGGFMMGSPYSEKGRVHFEGPRHKVTVPDLLGKVSIDKQAGPASGGGLLDNGKG